MEVRELCEKIGETLGIGGYKDIYFFCARIGNNRSDFDCGFNWEPFRDLSGPLVQGPNAVPVIVISQTDPLQEPKVERRTQPADHFLITISKNLSAATIANCWLETIIAAGAQHGSYKGPFDWFTAGLGIKSSDLTPKAGEFLLGS